MTLHQLRVFAKVAELQSFTEAAKALRLTQPSVSSLIQGLVRELKYKLFERRGMKIALTPEGKVLLRRAQEALGVIEGTKDEIAEIHGLKKGKLAVGGALIAAASFLPGAVQSFKKRHPGVEIALKIQRSDNLEKKLLKGELDLAILVFAARSPNLISEPYRDEEIVVVAPPQHPLARRRSVPLDLIAKERLIAQEKGALVRDMVERGFAKYGLPFKPVLEVDIEMGARDAIRRAVTGGLGIGFLSKCQVMADLKAGWLKVLKVPELKLKRTMYIVIHKNQLRSPLTQSFVESLRQYRK
jgi:DNA-binding transcriptional LysR family regulator